LPIEQANGHRDNDKHYRAAAHSLGEGFLGSKFGQSNLDQAEVSKIHRIEAFKENAILLAGDHAQHMGVMALGAQAARSNIAVQEKRSKEAKRTADNILFLDLLGQAEAYAAQLAADVAEIEAGYEAQYGDAWIEQIAMEVLDPDAIPERREGEDIVSYRERVKETLLAEMINPATGDVKQEYTDSEHANWAERRWKHEQVDAQMDIATDESRPQAEREAAVQAVIETGRADDATYAITSFDAGDAEYEMLGEAVANIQEDTSAEVTNQADLDAFFAP